MEFSQLQQRSREIRDRYAAANQAAGRPQWGSAEYLSGMVADIGALSTLVMVQNGFREGGADLDSRIAHELADCLWSVIILADELDVDMEAAFFATMDQIDARFQSKTGTTSEKDESRK
ncbi:MAG TPA: hypothetical protein VD767_04215 [Thermomicrobiales bacterium]|nr:hypothetical protein [Thermomicrobiales bacterium]